MLTVSGLSKYYGSKKVLDGIGLELKRSQIRTFLGPNGAGKTTTFNIIAGIEGKDGGVIRLNGRNLAGLPVFKRARLGLAYLPQETSLFRGLLVRENLEIYLKRQGLGSGRSEDRLHRTLELLDILELKERNVTTLSSGQKRKVEIGRALVLSPDYFLLDEPFSDLDPRSVREMEEILTSLKEEENLGIAISDHRAREALSIADFNYLIQDGQIIASGDSNEIVESEKARQTYFVN